MKFYLLTGLASRGMDDKVFTHLRQAPSEYGPLAEMTKRLQDTYPAKEGWLHSVVWDEVSATELETLMQRYPLPPRSENDA